MDGPGTQRDELRHLFSQRIHRRARTTDLDPPVPVRRLSDFAGTPPWQAQPSADEARNDAQPSAAEVKRITSRSRSDSSPSASTIRVATASTSLRSA